MGAGPPVANSLPALAQRIWKDEGKQAGVWEAAPHEPPDDRPCRDRLLIHHSENHSSVFGRLLHLPSPRHTAPVPIGTIHSSTWTHHEDELMPQSPESRAHHYGFPGRAGLRLQCPPGLPASALPLQQKRGNDWKMHRPIDQELVVDYANDQWQHRQSTNGNMNKGDGNDDDCVRGCREGLLYLVQTVSCCSGWYGCRS